MAPSLSKSTMSSITEINSLTQSIAVTHAFTEQEIEKILFPNMDGFDDSSVDTSLLDPDLRAYILKETRLSLHGCTLSEYTSQENSTGT